MAQVTVTIAARVYRMACGEGEEAHIEGLARMVDTKIDTLRSSFGEIGDQRITVMAALTFADELSEAKRKIGELEMDLFNARRLHEEASVQSHGKQQNLANTLGKIATRIEALSQTLNSPAS